MSRVNFSSPNLEALTLRLEGMVGLDLQVGWFESAKYDSTPVAGIMAQNEFGNPARSIPARPFMRPTAESKRTEWATTARQGFRASLNGGITPSQVMNILGLSAVGDIKNTITTADFAPLSPVTIALRKLKNEGYVVGGALVGAVAGAVARGETGPGQLGDQSFGNKDPLRDTSYAISTLTYEVN